VMDTTLDSMATKKTPEPSAEEVAARELVRLAREQGLSLAGPVWSRSSPSPVLETALNEEMTEPLGHEKNRGPPGRESTNVPNGTSDTATTDHGPGLHHTKGLTRDFSSAPWSSAGASCLGEI
jgi:putative transposase